MFPFLSALDFLILRETVSVTGPFSLGLLQGSRCVSRCVQSYATPVPGSLPDQLAEGSECTELSLNRDSCQNVNPNQIVRK